MQDMPEATPSGSAQQTIVAFDFGLRRIGVAVGQTVTGSASPIGVVANNNDGPNHQRIAEIVREWRPDILVVGMPLHADGSASDMQVPIRAFIDELARYELPVGTVDERYTSLEAEAALKAARQSGCRGRIQKHDIDAAAAVLIAERYLSSPQASEPCSK